MTASRLDWVQQPTHRSNQLSHQLKRCKWLAVFISEQQVFALAILLLSFGSRHFCLHCC